MSYAPAFADYTLIRRYDDVGLLPLSSPTTLLGAGITSTTSGSVSFGFTFGFDGADYTSGTVFSAGYLRFAGVIGSASNSNLFAANTSIILAPWWDSLETREATGYIKAETQGSAPFRRCVVEWYSNLNTGNNTVNYHAVKFQLVLFETWNRIEFRYGDIELGGAPSTTSYSASIGVKTDTSVTATNYRDFYSGDNVLLGGKDSSGATNLKGNQLWTELPTYVFAPNWPLLDRMVVIGPEHLSGGQDPYSEPLGLIAANSNWLYCNHRPPLTNFTVDLHGGTVTSGDHWYVVPIDPSLDSLTYEFRVGTYNSTAANLTLVVGYDSQPDPQPQTDGDWTTLSTETQTGVSGYVWWPTFTVAIPAGSDFLRFKLTASAGTSALMSALVLPETITALPTATTASGWERMGIAQIRAEGAAIHPEYLNRAYRNVARVLRDRKQCVFSAVRDDKSDYALSSFSGRASRTYNLAPASLKGQAGATLTFKLYAYELGSGGKVWVREQNGEAIEFTVENNGNEYRLQSDTLTIRSESPVFQVTVDPDTGLRIAALVAEWTPGE